MVYDTKYAAESKANRVALRDYAQQVYCLKYFMANIFRKFANYNISISDFQRFELQPTKNIFLDILITRHW